MDVSGFLVEHIGTEHAVLGDHAEFSGGDEVDGEVFLVKGDVEVFVSGFDEGFGDFPAGGVLGMEDASVAVASFSAEGEVGTVFVEVDAAGDEFLDGFAGFGEDGAHCVFVAEAGPGIKGIGDVALHAVAFFSEAFWQDAGDATLGPGGVGFDGLAFGDYGDGAVLSCTDGEGEAGDTTADD